MFLGAFRTSPVHSLYVEANEPPLVMRRTRGSNDLSLHEVELSGNNRCQQIEINTYPDSPLFISTGFLPRVSLKRLN